MSRANQFSTIRSSVSVVFTALTVIFILTGCKKDAPDEPQLPAQDGWVVQQSGTTNALYSAHFVDANTGTAIGNNGVILRTTNGGFSK